MYYTKRIEYKKKINKQKPSSYLFTAAMTHLCHRGSEMDTGSALCCALVKHNVSQMYNTHFLGIAS